MWVFYALGAALFAGFQAILSKAGVKTTPPSLATALRTIVALLGSWLMVVVAGSAPSIFELDPRTWLFLILSGLSTGASWLLLFKALQLGPVSKVAVIDRSSIILTILLAILIFGETDNLLWKTVGIILIAVGTYLMIQKTAGSGAEQLGRGPWMLYAAGAAVFASLTAILGKVGIEGVDSSLGTAIRTAVVLVMAWIVVGVKHEGKALWSTPRRELLFIILSGAATTVSWLFYWKAMQVGPASGVVPVDKMSIVVTVTLAAVFFKEKQSRQNLVGLGLIVAGTVAMVVGA